MITFILGGARAGKSTLALERAEQLGVGVTFLATAPRIDGDDDLAERIDRHRAERPTSWRTIEEQVDLAAALTTVDTPAVIVDCLTVWVGNLMFHGLDADALDRSDAAIDAIAASGLQAIVVSNEVGLGIVPADVDARRYRDVLGRVNQRWAAAADDALLLVAGLVVPLTP